MIQTEEHYLQYINRVTTPFYLKDIKYPKGNSSEPLTLAICFKEFEK